MTYQPPQVYDELHFREYLDGGNEKVPLLNWNNLQQNIPAYTRYRFDEHDNADSHSDDYKNNDNLENSTYSQAELQQQVQAYSHICQQLLGQKVSSIDFPGGTHRSSFRLTLENGSNVIASRRFDPSRSFYESLIMRRLEKHQAPIPRHFAYNGLVMIQENLSGIRLSDALLDATEEQYSLWMGNALASLIDIHNIGNREGLTHAVPIIGSEPDWLIALIDRTALLGSYMNIPCPEVPVKQIYNCLLLLKPSFIKWDARPGNAMLDSDGNIKWFDWEHCCARNPIDDMAWLLCDDAVPFYPEAENQLIDSYLSGFADGRNLDDALTYLQVFGTHHACVRLGKILDDKGSDSWITYENRIEVEPGFQIKIAQRLCKRAAYWSKQNKMTYALKDWFEEIANTLPNL